jgi:gas vesicle protein
MSVSFLGKRTRDVMTSVVTGQITPLDIGNWTFVQDEIRNQGLTLKRANLNGFECNQTTTVGAAIVAKVGAVNSSLAASGSLNSTNDLTISTNKVGGQITLTPNGGPIILNDLTVANTQISGLVTPTSGSQATTKNYVDAGDALKLNLTGGTLTGAVSGTSMSLSAAPSTGAHATNKTYVDVGDAIGITYTNTRETSIRNYVDTGDALKLNLTGGTLTGAVSGTSMSLSAAPSTGAHATNKTYVDAADALKLNLSGGTLTGNLNARNITLEPVNGTLTCVGLITQSLKMDNMSRYKTVQISSNAGTSGIYSWPVAITSDGVTYTESGADSYFTIGAGMFVVNWTVSRSGASAQLETWATLDSDGANYGWTMIPAGMALATVTVHIQVTLAAQLLRIRWFQGGSTNDLVPINTSTAGRMYIHIRRVL